MEKYSWKRFCISHHGRNDSKHHYLNSKGRITPTLNWMEAGNNKGSHWGCFSIHSVLCIIINGGNELINQCPGIKFKKWIFKELTMLFLLSSTNITSNMSIYGVYSSIILFLPQVMFILSLLFSKSCAKCFIRSLWPRYCYYPALNTRTPSLM